jgi:tetratricopeptide (TPR) repeat protein
VDEHRTPFAELRRILNAVRSGEILSEANARLSAKDLKGALEKANAAREKSPTNDNAWVALANIHLQMGQKTEALSALGRAVELNPANKKQLLRNSAFETLYKDPAFLKIVGP